MFEENEREPIYIRLGINLVKIAAIFLTMMSFFVYYAVIGNHPGALLQATFLTGIIFCSGAAVFDVFSESGDIAAGLVTLFSIVLVFGGGAGLIHVLGTDAFSPSWVLDVFLSLLTTFFVLMTLLLSLNDADMEGIASYYFYPLKASREGRFLAHWAFNLGSILIALLGMKESYAHYGVRGAAVWMLSFSGALIAFSVTDEILRRKYHWSFFWHNTAEPVVGEVPATPTDS